MFLCLRSEDTERSREGGVDVGRSHLRHGKRRGFRLQYGRGNGGGGSPRKLQSGLGDLFRETTRLDQSFSVDRSIRERIKLIGCTQPMGYVEQVEKMSDRVLVFRRPNIVQRYFCRTPNLPRVGPRNAGGILLSYFQKEPSAPILRVSSTLPRFHCFLLHGGKGILVFRIDDFPVFSPSRVSGYNRVRRITIQIWTVAQIAWI